MSNPPPDQAGDDPQWGDRTIVPQQPPPEADTTRVMAPSGTPQPHAPQQYPHTQQAPYDPYQQQAPYDPYQQQDPHQQYDQYQAAGQGAGYYEPPNRTGWFVALVAFLLVLAVAGVFYLARQIGGDDPGDPVAELVPVPTVIGEAEAPATNRLADAGFVVKAQYEESAEVEPGIVIGQDPQGGTELATGSEVLLTVSASTEMIQVPNVVGALGTEAVALLEALGFVVVIQRQESEDFENDRVISQSVEPGQQANAGATVILVISTGSDQQVTVPSVVGLTADQATLQLGLAGFIDWSLVEEPSDTVPPGVVIRVSPEPGATVAASTQVTVVVSSGPATTTTPSTDTTSTTTTTQATTTSSATTTSTTEATTTTTTESTTEPTTETSDTGTDG